MKSKEEIAMLVKKQRETSVRSLGTQYDNTITCQSYYNAINPMSYEDRIQFMDEYGRRRRALVNFGAIQPNVDSVTGFMAQNRRQAKFFARVPKSENQQRYSKNMNALYTYHRENTNADQLETLQDADMMINGYGAIETDLSYIIGNAASNPNGDILKNKLDPLKVGWDPNARGKNLLDKRWVYYFEDYDLKEALTLFQDSVEDDFQQVSDTESNDTGYVYNPYGGLYDRIKLDADVVEWANSDQDLVRVYNHQWMEYETFYKAYNPLYAVTDPMDAMFIKARLEMMSEQIKNDYSPEGINAPDMFEFDPLAEDLTMDEQTKGLFVKEFGDMFKPIAFKRKVFYTAVISGKHVFTCFKSISQQGFSVKFKTGIWNNTDKFWAGMVNAMIEPQKYRNKALTEILFTIAANSKGGVMVEEDAVEDIADFETKWAKTDAVIKVQSGAISGNKILQKAQGAVPTGLENIVQLSDAAIAANGVDPAFLGDISGQESGVLYKRRIRQCISKLAQYFDSITLAQKEDARLSEDLIRVWVQNNNGAMVEITGDDGQQDQMQVSEDMLVSQYGVSIQEAPQTPEDQQETAQLIGSYGDKISLTNPTAGAAFYAESIQLLPLDGDVKNRLVKVLQPQDSVPMAQFQQLQQQLQQLQSEINAANVAKTVSETKLNEIKAQQASADTARTLEEAANKGLENDIIRTKGYDKATVTI